MGDIPRRHHLRVLIGRMRRLLFLQEGAILELSEGLLELFPGIHDDRAMPGNGLFERLPRHQQEANPLLPRLDDDLVTTVEQNEGAVVGYIAGAPSGRARRRSDASRPRASG